MYNLYITVFGQGAVEPIGGSYEEGSVVPILAIPSSGWKFFKWANTDGDNANPTSVHMNSNKNIAVYFSEVPTFNPKPLLIGVGVIVVIGLAVLFMKTQKSMAPKLAYSRART